ncbi:Metallo-beta-lactamase superfamily protein [Candidatus Desulfosporosinus infrequens]|uniref:Metallo-beta-lactamase superfamily protein n=1 Tax=Candidatus Desulfosporosinus infrequens TaxID=2043169 RepID=A0A2U3LEZ7_9FIRM|nr:Metallo-beta-lactamase superfamily protein [Candidatus Desulfosporosinus infrequens]
MKIAKGIETLELTMNFAGNQSVIHPTLIWDNDTVILVDTGLPGQLQEIREAMDKAGVPFGKLSKVILTHHDIDHIGSLPDVVRESDHKIEVLAHAAEKPYIEGEKTFVKITPERIAKMLESLPDEQREQAQAMFANPPKASVNTTVADGEVLPYCGGITVIFTSGHTPGHICLYHNESKTLITGDAMIILAGQLLGPNPQATPDMDTAIQALKKFTAYDIETVICYHGGIYKDNVNQRLVELVKGQ